MDLFSKNRKDFMRRFITTDETWVHHYTPELKNKTVETMEAQGFSAPKKVQDDCFSGQDHGVSFLGGKGHHHD